MDKDAVIRRFDDLGRICIPKQFRRRLFPSDNYECFPMEIFMKDDDIIIRKYVRESDFCVWNYNVGFEHAKSKCGSLDTKRIDIYSFKYCPYCNKKILINEDLY